MKIIPLRLQEREQKKKNTAIFGADADDDNKLKVAKDIRTKETVKAENKAKRMASKEAKSALTDFDKKTAPSKEAQDMPKEKILEASGISEESSIEDIKAAVDSLLYIQYLGKDEKLDYTTV